MLETDRVRQIFADALEMIALGKVRNAAEKAWGATNRATDALVRQDRRRTGEDAADRRRPQGAGNRR